MGARALDFVANDGSLLKEMQAVGLHCVGVAPARNIVDKAQAGGPPIICGH